MEYLRAKLAAIGKKAYDVGVNRHILPTGRKSDKIQERRLTVTEPIDAELYYEARAALDQYMDLEREFFTAKSSGWEGGRQRIGVNNNWQSFLPHRITAGDAALRYEVDLPAAKRDIAAHVYARYGDIVVDELYFNGVYADTLAICDGLPVEFEFKTNFVDYLRDFEKVAKIGLIEVNKHLALLHGMLFVSKFYFVVPAGMVSLPHLPAHAGLISFEPGTPVHTFSVLREAPLLRQDWDPFMWENLAKGLMRKLSYLRAPLPAVGDNLFNV